MVKHSDAINIARRLTQRAENDLLQENLYEEEDEDDKYSKRKCQEIAQKLSSVSDLPKECRKHTDVVQDLQRRLTKSDKAVAFKGMRAGQAQAAMAAREKGKLSHAQIQRRMTQTRTFTKKKD